MSFLESIIQLRKAGKKALAVLIDPDKIKDDKSLNTLMELIHHSKVDFVFIGGSLLIGNNFHACVKKVKALCELPVILFPGSPSQIAEDADAILLLSLISGRNAELLIGQHVIAAPQLKRSGLEIIPTGYMLVDCGRATTASYVSQTFPLPWNKPEIAAATAIAGEMLGLRTIYLDGGSGAEKPISTEMIHAVRIAVDLPIIVGGGIRDEDQARSIYASGADVIVIGTAFEEAPELLFSLSQSRYI